MVHVLHGIVSTFDSLTIPSQLNCLFQILWHDDSSNPMIGSNTTQERSGTALGDECNSSTGIISILYARGELDKGIDDKENTPTDSGKSEDTNEGQLYLKAAYDTSNVECRIHEMESQKTRTDPVIEVRLQKFVVNGAVKTEQSSLTKDGHFTSKLSESQGNTEEDIGNFDEVENDSLNIFGVAAPVVIDSNLYVVRPDTVIA